MVSSDGSGRREGTAKKKEKQKRGSGRKGSKATELLHAAAGHLKAISSWAVEKSSQNSRRAGRAVLVTVIKMIRRIITRIIVVYAFFVALGALVNAPSMVPRQGANSSTLEAMHLKDALHEALRLSAVCVRAWATVGLSVVLPASDALRTVLIRAYAWATPSLRSVSLEVATYLTHLPTSTKISTAVVAALAVVAWWTQREIKRRRYVERAIAKYQRTLSSVQLKYNAVVRSIRRKSKLAADVLPHALFFGASLAAMRAFPEAMAKIEYNEALFGASRFLHLGWMVQHGWPLVATCVALARHADMHKQYHEGKIVDAKNQKKRSDLKQNDTTLFSSVWSSVRRRISGATDSASKRKKSSRQQIDVCSCKRQCSKSLLNWLQYWGAVGILECAQRMPVLGHLLVSIPRWYQIRALGCVWMLNPFTRGSAVAVQALVPFLSRHVKSMPGSAPSTRAKGNIVLNAMVALGAITPASRERVVEAFSTGGSLLLVATPFLFTPSFIASIGIAVACYGHAGYATVVVARDVALKIDLDRDACAVESSTCRRWMQYWIVVHVYFAVRQCAVDGIIGWLPLWTHTNLLIAIWMQLPYFQGATRLYNAIQRRALAQQQTKDDTAKRDMTVARKGLNECTVDDTRLEEDEAPKPTGNEETRRRGREDLSVSPVSEHIEEDAILDTLEDTELLPAEQTESISLLKRDERAPSDASL